MFHRLSLVLLALLFAAVAYAQMYRWVDRQGKVHYTDTPPPPSEVKQVEEKKFTSNVIEGGESYAVGKAAKDYPVTLYTGDCGEACTQAKALLAKRGIPFTERQPAKNPKDAEAFKKISSENVIPVVTIGSMTLKGFQESQWNSSLDIAGYPRSGGPAKPEAGARKP